MTGRWEEAIKVQGHLFALADELPEKLAVARNAAHLVEYEVKDLVRAFRAYLNAFRLAPDDEEIVGHLWRLATSIGRYHSEIAVEEADIQADQTSSESNGVTEADADVDGHASDQTGSDDAGSDRTETEQADGDGLDVVSEEVDVEVEIDAGGDADAQPAR